MKKKTIMGRISELQTIKNQKRLFKGDKMTKGTLISVLILMIFLGVGCSYNKKQTDATEGIPRMTKEELKTKLDNEDVVVIDVRIFGHLIGSEHKIKGAVRENPMDVNYWHNYPTDKTLVLYCA